MPDKAIGTIKIKLVRSPICTPEKHKLVVKGLGLRKLNQVVERPDTPVFRGMVKKCPHLRVVVEEISAAGHPPSAEAAPVEVAPVEAAPAEAAPVAAAPVGAAAAEAATAGVAPAEAGPVEAAATEAAPVEAAPVEAAPVEAALIEPLPAPPLAEELPAAGAPRELTQS